MSNGERKSAADLRDSRKPVKEQDAEEIEVVNRQMAPKASVKVERKINLGDYNSVTVQAFLSSGTIESMRGDVVDADGDLREDVASELASIVEDLESIATGRVVEAGKDHAQMENITGDGR